MAKNSRRKGIILAGGSGTRLFPLTTAVNKQLLPVYDKPMIYYPLSTLMLAGIQEILIISTPEELPRYSKLLGAGERLGLKLNYQEQVRPYGLAHALILAEKFLAGCPCALILGDNIFFGEQLPKVLQKANKSKKATIFGYRVKDPSSFGIAEIDFSGKILSLEEKPAHPKSDLAVTGLYFYDENASELAKRLKPSARGELEITDLNRLYLQQDKLDLIILDAASTYWVDTGTADALLNAAKTIYEHEKDIGKKIGAIEQIAYEKGFINLDMLLFCADQMSKSAYGQYLYNYAQQKLKP